VFLDRRRVGHEGHAREDLRAFPRSLAHPWMEGKPFEGRGILASSFRSARGLPPKKERMEATASLKELESILALPAACLPACGWKNKGVEPSGFPNLHNDNVVVVVSTRRGREESPFSPPS